jgi:biotin/methionine sulfoxide reductase
VELAFTEGRSAGEWLRHLYEPTRMALIRLGHDAPDFDAFWAAGELLLPTMPWDGGVVREFRQDPDSRKLPTPTGMVEIASATIASFGYDDCPGHPAWLPPVEGVGSSSMRDFPLYLVANQPATRLHSQLDFGAVSLASKVKGREPVRIHPSDAADRGIADGDVVRLFNHRGACLAGAVISDAVRPGVVQLATGAWYDPLDPTTDDPLCVHGNPNVLTRDAGTSKLAQACTGQLTIVQIERFNGPLPPIRAFDPPAG